jgi:hypothetical protein
MFILRNTDKSENKKQIDIKCQSAFFMHGYLSALSNFFQTKCVEFYMINLKA